MPTQHPRAGRIKLPAAAVTYDGAKPQVRRRYAGASDKLTLQIYRPPPYLGQHTNEVLSELGYEVAEIERMRSEGVV